MNREMKFKVGDKIKGISDEYTITNKDMYLGEIKEICEYYIIILVLKHKNSNKIGKTYTAFFPEGKFEILESKNTKKNSRTYKFALLFFYMHVDCSSCQFHSSVILE